MGAIFELESLKKAYAGRTVLDLQSLSVERGEILALVGPSGAGKSTLLRLLNFLEPPDGGELRYKGVAAAGVPLELRRQVIERLTTIAGGGR